MVWDPNAPGSTSQQDDRPGGSDYVSQPVSGPFVGLNSAVEGLGYYVYGASYEGADINNYSANTRYPFRVTRRMGLIQVNRAVSGDESSDMWFNMSEKNSTRRLAPATKGIIQIAGALNDALRNGTAQYRKETFKNNLKACIYRAFCQSIVEATDAGVTYSGTGVATSGWATGSNAIAGAFAAAMNYKSTNTADATADVSLTGDTLCLFTYDLCTPSYTVPSARLIVSVDGNVKADRTPVLAYKSSTSAGWSVAGAVIPLVGLSNAAHAVHVQAKASSTQGGFIQSFGVIDRTQLPQIMINKFMYLDPARPPSGYSVATVDAYRGYVDEVVAEVISEIPEAAAAITVVDPMAAGSPWNPVTGVGTSDNLHPNDLGEAQLTQVWVDKMSALPFRKGMNKL